MMPYNPKADIHAWTWYRVETGKSKGTVLLCTRASYTENKESGEITFTTIEMLDYLKCEPREVPYEVLAEWLTNGDLAVVKKPY